MVGRQLDGFLVKGSQESLRKRQLAHDVGLEVGVERVVFREERQRNEYALRVQ